jgi:hypothetical protein
LKPALRRFLKTARPTDVSRGLAPTTATDRGENSLSSRYVDMGSQSAAIFELKGTLPLAAEFDEDHR